ncbi:hypothetical protein pdam_00025183 [Pocillopora damicornis]|uniref:Prolyl endopeptidase n=1 Tax=Pocillopora damicornis TaxID=46731 RepID=A0A3M6T7J0_POCDA|nr:hypothetical protein pdam_00025183 [Pocillopora damicornis]
MASVIHYPKSRRDENAVNDYHGSKIHDPYVWLEDPDSEETKRFIEQQNAITMPYLSACETRENFKNRLTEMWDYPKYGCPIKKGAKYFYLHNSGLQNQSVLYVQDSLESEAQVFLDPNKLSEDGTVALAKRSFSDDGEFFAYSLSHKGSDWVTIKRYPTGDKADGTETDLNLNQKLYYHVLGTSQSDDVLCAEFPEHPKWSTGAGVSDCGRYLILTPHEGSAPFNRLFYCDLKYQEGITGLLPFVKVVDNFDAQYEYITNEGTLFTFKTNFKSPRYKLINIDFSKPEMSILRLHKITGERLMTFPLDIGSIVEHFGKRKDSEIFYKFTSFLTPEVIYRCDLTQEDPQPKGIELDGSHPLYLFGYGGFNISVTPSFSVSRIVFMRHLGGIIAIPNLRGGGEYGETWHQAGCFGNKQNVFDDFQYAAIYLTQQKYTSPEKITIVGGSNGGLLVGACINQRPELFGCAVSHVPVMDMLKFHKFTIGHAWTTDFGSPDKEEDFKWLIKYSPLHNIKIPESGAQYPALLLLTADHDDRVVPLHSLKYIAQLQHCVGSYEKQSNPLLIRIDTKAGHGFGKPTAKIVSWHIHLCYFRNYRLLSRWTDK